MLTEIGAGDVPQIMVMNKIDLTRAEAAVQRDDYGKIGRVFLSARTGEGLGLLRDALAEVARTAAATPEAPTGFSPNFTDTDPIQT